jgi:hypothetical protein
VRVTRWLWRDTPAWEDAIVTEPPQSTSPPQSTEPAIVEWGGERRPMLSRLAGWYHPGLPWSLAGLGAVAMFGSLIGEWQVIDSSFTQSVIGTESIGLGSTPVWGVSWLFGATLLAVCSGLALAGQPQLRGFARTIGLAVATVQLGILVAATVNLSQQSALSFIDDSVEISLGRGLYAAFACVLLFGAALYLSMTTAAKTPAVVAEPVRGAGGRGPEDLVVGPADPLVHPTEDHTWR